MTNVGNINSDVQRTHGWMTRRDRRSFRYLVLIEKQHTDTLWNGLQLLALVRLIAEEKVLHIPLSKPLNSNSSLNAMFIEREMYPYIFEVFKRRYLFWYPSHTPDRELGD